MFSSNLYPAIFERKSIRKYETADLTESQLALVRQEIARVQPLLSAEAYTLELAQAKDGWRIYGFCADTCLSNINLGFVLQQLDLSLHCAGLGRLWFGMGTAPKNIQPPEGMVYAMALKVGVSAKELTRTPEEFDRKSMEEVTSDSMTELFEAVRLAPSARNSQPWFFERTDREIDVYCANPPVFLRKHMTSMNQIDVGIALCHLALALQEGGMIGEPSIKEEAPPVREEYLRYTEGNVRIEKPNREGYYYCLSLRMQVCR